MKPKLYSYIMFFFQAADVGGSIFLHTFGAYFGLATSYMLYRKEFLKNGKEASSYNSDIFGMIGKFFLKNIYQNVYVLQVKEKEANK